ncbi:MAG TPA: peptidyl-prolyl cis-trans isomerase [Desulfomonilaceae bacterium]|nr:peptidyl-prolyl cis-trans isomerase [Desulfomonilaceae bacterium]
MKSIALFVALAAILPMNAIAQPVISDSSGDVLAKVGNYEITRQMLDHIIATINEENRVPFLTPDGRKKILDEVISFTLFAEAAKAQGIDKEPAIKTRLDYLQTEYLAREYFRRYLAKMPQISEETLMAYYKDHASEFKPPEEIKARHILVKTEAQANKILDELKAGKDFAELAKKNSIDPAAAAGGKLEMPDGRDWLPRGVFEKSFEHVLFKIPKGQFGGPVKTQFGWHILKVDDLRQPETPPFVQVRSQIRNRLQEQKNEETHAKLTEELKKNIPVTIK